MHLNLFECILSVRSIINHVLHALQLSWQAVFVRPSADAFCERCCWYYSFFLAGGWKRSPGKLFWQMHSVKDYYEKNFSFWRGAAKDLVGHFSGRCILWLVVVIFFLLSRGMLQKICWTVSGRCILWIGSSTYYYLTVGMLQKISLDSFLADAFCED